VPLIGVEPCWKRVSQSDEIRGAACLSVQNATCRLVVISGGVFRGEERSRSVALGKSIEYRQRFDG
jgi:hypothetical protein